MPLFGKKKRRAVVVGLDGMPYSLLQELAAAEVMPHLASLGRERPFARMTVTLPEISAVSWPSFATGLDPGGHGVFGFTDLKAGTYELRFTSSADVKAPTIWERLGRSRKRAVVINQPSTYPARPINGALIAGFVAIDFDRAVMPPPLRPRLRELGYEIDVDTVKCREDHDLLQTQLRETLDGRRRAAAYLWDHESWDYFELVITGTDRLQHYLWDAVADPNHPRHEFCREYYREVDRLVGEIYERAAEAGCAFYLLSDHGFCGVGQEFYLNTWLAQEGYLAFDGEAQDTFEAMAPRTRAFALDPNRIYVHAAGKYPRGAVRPGDVAALRAELRDRLRGVSYDGRPVFREVFAREEIYDGPHAAQGPDLVAVAYPGFDVKAHLAKPEVFARTNLTGMHTYDDAVFWSAEAPPANVHITDLADLILANY
ncbi:MAG: alkaline phosphatase family protein [Candidatus Coatesbacteria bacterium]|nr:MAG: alkaline phosphatase family protein [Candidatus Coatesbacteria bacterium]